MLRYLLKAGNALNSGLASGDAAGVALGSRGAVATARGKGGANLVDYVAEIFAERGQAADLDFVDALPSLAEAARYVDDDHTRGALRKLRSGLAQVQAEAKAAEASLSSADRKRAAALRKKSGEAPAPEVASPAAPATAKGRAALDAQATVRFVVEAGRCVDEAAKAVAGLEAKIAALDAATKKCRAYFGATGGPAAAALKLVFGALDGFASEVRRSRDKLRRKLAAKERNAKRAAAAAAKADPAAAAPAPAARIRGARTDAAGPVLARTARPARDAPAAAAAAPRPAPARPRVALSASAQSAVDRAFALKGGRRANAPTPRSSPSPRPSRRTRPSPTSSAPPRRRPTRRRRRRAPRTRSRGGSSDLSPNPDDRRPVDHFMAHLTSWLPSGLMPTMTASSGVHPVSSAARSHQTHLAVTRAGHPHWIPVVLQDRIGYASTEWLASG